MITWMQRHKKYLIVTIWISTIAFVGAGFVGWGQYNYGDKAGAIAKVGEIELTRGELQKSYSQLYAQYNEMFQGNFDEEQAKNFGLQKQALKQLIDQALLLNLAKEYKLDVSDSEILAKIITQKYFFKDGVFNKDTYKQVLSRNNLTLASYELDLKKQLTIEKLLKLLPVTANNNETDILNTLINIADKINYKVLTPNDVTVDMSDAKIKAFWETQKQNFMSEVIYNIKYIKQEKVNLSYDEAKISSYYAENKSQFKNEDGKILPLKEAKQQIISKLNDKSTKKQALRKYIDYKKDKLSKDVILKETSISKSNNILNTQALKKISELSLTSPYMKPIQIGSSYYIVKLTKIIPSKIKDYKDAKVEILPLYVEQMKKDALISLAQKSLKTFKGQITDFITSQDADKLKDLTQSEANEFLTQLFSGDKKSTFITLNNGKIILYTIMEQKLLSKNNNNLNDSIVKFKNTIFNEALIKNLQKVYSTEIFIEGL